MNKKNAFTLIELLVVISIIAILVAILFPAAQRMLETGRAKEDANNLRNIGQGIRMYLNDHNDSFFDLEAEADETWPKALKKKYVPDWKSFRSPFDKITASRPKTEEGSIPVSYGLNEQMMVEKKTFTGKWTAPPSSLIMGAPAVDTAVDGSDVKFRADAFSAENIAIRPEGQGGQYGTHEKRYAVNVLFFDGHVAQMEWKKYSDNTTKSGIEQWFPLGEEEDSE